MPRRVPSRSHAARRTAVVAGVALVLALAGCGHRTATPSVAARQGGIEVVDPYVPVPASRHQADLYLTLVSTARAGDTLQRVTSPAAREVLVVADSRLSGVATFAAVAQVRIPGRRTVRLAPGGTHIQLIRPRRSLKPGDTVTVRLIFAVAGQVTLAVPVVAGTP